MAFEWVGNFFRALSGARGAAGAARTMEDVTAAAGAGRSAEDLAAIRQVVREEIHAAGGARGTGGRAAGAADADQNLRNQKAVYAGGTRNGGVISASSWRNFFGYRFLMEGAKSFVQQTTNWALPGLGKIITGRIPGLGKSATAAGGLVGASSQGSATAGRWVGGALGIGVGGGALLGAGFGFVSHFANNTGQTWYGDIISGWKNAGIGTAKLERDVALALAGGVLDGASLERMYASVRGAGNVIPHNLFAGPGASDPGAGTGGGTTPQPPGRAGTQPPASPPATTTQPPASPPASGGGTGTGGAAPPGRTDTPAAPPPTQTADAGQGGGNGGTPPADPAEAWRQSVKELRKAYDASIPTEGENPNVPRPEWHFTLRGVDATYTFNRTQVDIGNGAKRNAYSITRSVGGQAGAEVPIRDPQQFAMAMDQAANGQMQLNYFITNAIASTAGPGGTAPFDPTGTAMRAIALERERVRARAQAQGGGTGSTMPPPGSVPPVQSQGGPGGGAYAGDEPFQRRMEIANGMTRSLGYGRRLDGPGLHSTQASLPLANGMSVLVYRTLNATNNMGDTYTLNFRESDNSTWRIIGSRNHVDQMLQQYTANGTPGVVNFFRETYNNPMPGVSVHHDTNYYPSVPRPYDQMNNRGGTGGGYYGGMTPPPDTAPPPVAAAPAQPPAAYGGQFAPAIAEAMNLQDGQTGQWINLGNNDYLRFSRRAEGAYVASYASNNDIRHVNLTEINSMVTILGSANQQYGGANGIRGYFADQGLQVTVTDRATDGSLLPGTNASGHNGLRYAQYRQAIGAPPPVQYPPATRAPTPLFPGAGGNG